MPDPLHPHPPGQTEQRLTSLEEHAAFAERTVEELADEVRLLNARVRELTQRLAAAEARVERAQTQGTAEPPNANPIE